MSGDLLIERIARIEGGPETPEGAADPDRNAPPGGGAESGAGAPPPEDLAEVEEFLVDALMGGIAWAYESRATVAGPHWILTEPETVTIRKPAARVVAKWAPTILAYVPSFALLWKDEIALCMVLLAVTKGRIMIDRQLAAEAAQTDTTKGAPHGEAERTEG